MCEYYIHLLLIGRWFIQNVPHKLKKSFEGDVGGYYRDCFAEKLEQHMKFNTSGQPLKMLNENVALESDSQRHLIDVVHELSVE